MPNVHLNLNVGDGLGFDQDNKLCVKCAGDYVYTVKDGVGLFNGLYVSDLVGNPGSVSDEWSTVPAKGTDVNNVNRYTLKFVDINREVTNLIFTYGLFRPAGYDITTRQPHTIAYTNQIKTVSDICDEMVFPLTRHPMNKTSFKPMVGELLQLVDVPTTRTVKDNTNPDGIATEDGLRSGNNTQTTKVLFCITEIDYASDNEYLVTSMKLMCLYAAEQSYGYITGREYEGSQTLVN